VAPSRFIQLATLCAAIMCCAGALHLFGGVDASASTPEIRFKSETFPLERLTPLLSVQMDARAATS
jgi:hypothetical protein